MNRIGILAGGGRLPLTIAESVTRRGGQVHIVGITGEADNGITRYPHTWVNLGQVGRMVTTLRSEGGELVIAGSVRRPNLYKLRPDTSFFRSLPQILGLLAGGDDSVLSRVVRFFEANGLVVRGAHEVAPDLLVGEGALGAMALPPEARADAAIGFAVRAALGPLDAGQAVVVSGGKVLAIEGAEGTDAMLERVAQLRASGLGVNGSGVLAKGPKPGQELRVDMPAIGPRTVDLGVAAGLAGLALEAGGVLLLDRAEAIWAANAKQFAVEGLPAGSVGSVAVHRDEASLTGRVMSRRRPGSRDRRDLEKGIVAVERLAPLGTGHGVVVASAYIVALAAAEALPQMLLRVRALRQWGVGERRRRGVLVCRARTCEPETFASLLAQAAAQGLSGVAMAGTADELAPLEDAGPALADAEGLFLVSCHRPDMPARPESSHPL